MLKVLMVISEAPPVVSGVSRVAVRLRDGLERLGYRVDVISLEDVPRFVLGEVRISRMAWLAPRLLLSRLDDYDIIHIHGPVPTFSDVALLLSAARPSSRRPHVVYTHHSEICLPIRGLDQLCKAYNWVHRQLARLADQVIVTTPSYAHALSKTAAPERICVVPWGVDSRQGPPEAKAERFRVLFVGQLRPYKGLDVLLGAARRLDAMDLHIVGGGHQEDHYREMAARYRLEHVHFRGRLNDVDLFDAYSQAHVLVLPSVTRQEAFGLVLLEGMAAGCVPLVSQLPGVTDVVGDAGLTFPTGDEAALASALLHLRDDPSLRAIYSARARARAKQYSWHRTIYWHHAIYRRLASLRQFGHALSTQPNENVALEHLLQDTVMTMSASAGSIMLLDPRGQLLRLCATAGLPGHVISSQGQRVGEGIAGFVASRNVPLILPEAFEGATRDDLATLQQREHIHSALSVPIRTDGRTLGVMNLSSHVRDRRFQTDDLEWLRVLARGTAHNLIDHPAFPRWSG